MSNVPSRAGCSARCIVAVLAPVVVSAIAALIAAPAAWLTDRVGIGMGGVIGASWGRRGAGPTVLLAMIPPGAPASCAFLVLVWKLQPPRSITTILPVYGPPVRATQPVDSAPE